MGMEPWPRSINLWFTLFRDITIRQYKIWQTQRIKKMWKVAVIITKSHTSQSNWKSTNGTTVTTLVASSLETTMINRSTFSVTQIIQTASKLFFLQLQLQLTLYNNLGRTLEVSWVRTRTTINQWWTVWTYLVIKVLSLWKVLVEVFWNLHKGQMLQQTLKWRSIRNRSLKSPCGPSQCQYHCITPTNNMEGSPH